MVKCQEKEIKEAFSSVRGQDQGESKAKHTGESLNLREGETII